MARRRRPCAYCGVRGVSVHRDHVVPRGLYPEGWEAGKIQRITVPACAACNNAWSNDEPHFRTVMLLAGEPNEPIRKIWDSKVARSFKEVDGRQRLQALADQMKPVVVDGTLRYKIYPGNDPKVIRIVKKIVRGLSYHHHLESVIDDSLIWADVRKLPVDEDLPNFGESGHCDPKIFHYWYEPQDDKEFASIWRLWFYEKREFIAMVFRRPMLS